MKIDLKHPIKVAGKGPDSVVETVKHVEWSDKLSTGDIIDAQDDMIIAQTVAGIMLPPGQVNPVRVSAHIIVKAIGRDIDFVRKLHPADFQTLDLKVNDFLS